MASVARKRLKTNIFCVYEHWRPDTGLPFYVGKGKGGRAKCLRQRPEYHKRIQKKLARLGLLVEVRKVFTHLDEEMAFTLEKAQIAYWKARGISLVNATDGGEGISGYCWTDEQRAAMAKVWEDPELLALISAKAKASNSLPEVKAAISKAVVDHWADPIKRAQHTAALTESVRSPEVRGKLREKALVWTNNPEHMAARTAALNAVTSNPEFIARRAAAVKAAINTPESRAIRSAAAIASRTPEVRARISVTLKATLAAKKAASLEGAFA